MSITSGLVITLKPMNRIEIRCTYETAEDFRGMHDLVADEFSVELQVDEDEIIFEGSEIDGQTGSLHIDRMARRFTQRSDVNGEWLILKGNC